MEITVSFLAGTTIKEAVTKAKELAVKMDLKYTLFDFNGISIAIGQQANIEKAVDKFQRALTGEFKIVIE